MESIVTNTPYEIGGNVLNKGGLIENLPAGRLRGSALSGQWQRVCIPVGWAVCPCSARP